jgi:hypothetical protein
MPLLDAYDNDSLAVATRGVCARALATAATVERTHRLLSKTWLNFCEGTTEKSYRALHAIGKACNTIVSLTLTLALTPLTSKQCC